MIPVTSSFVIENLPFRPDDAHKGTMGTMLNISGSYSMAGACILSSMLALKSGVGLLKVAVPESIYPIVSSNVYEAVFLPYKSESGTVECSFLKKAICESEKADAVLLGCGLSLTDNTVSFVTDFVRNCATKLLIDADGINAISKNINILKEKKADIVLTPHIKEMSRLCGLSTEYILENRRSVAENFAKEYSVVVVLKGKNTIITDGENTYINPTGNSGMAKGGCGDVLSGIIASLMAQGLSVLNAAVLGVYIHGLCGDVSADLLSKTSVLPRDIVDALPKVFKAIE